MQRKFFKAGALAVVAVMASHLFLRAQTNEAVPYPTGYLKWTRIKQATQPAGASTNNRPLIYHVYANDTAVAGLRDNKQFADGSVFVVDFFETQEDEGKLRQTSRAQVAVMVKDNQRHAKTGGWGFEQFKGDSETDRMIAADAPTKCYACHARQKDNDSVFSKYPK